MEPEQNEEEEFSSGQSDHNEFGQGRQPAGRADDDFDQDSADFGQDPGQVDTFRASAVPNQPYDEAVELSDEGEQPSPAVDGRAGPVDPETMAVANKPFDEAVELSSEDSVDDDGEREPPVVRPAGSAGSARSAESAGSGGEAGGSAAAPSAPTDGRRPQGGPQVTLSPMNAAGGNREDTEGSPQDQMASSKGMGMMAASQMGRGGMGGDYSGGSGLSPQGDPAGMGYGSGGGGGGSDDDDDDEGEGGDAEGEGGPVGEGMYDPAEYASLAVSSEIKELFQYITRYTPRDVEPPPHPDLNTHPHPLSHPQPSLTLTPTRTLSLASEPESAPEPCL